MKKYEVLAIVLMVLYVISYAASPLHVWLMKMFYGPEFVSTLSMYQHVILSLQMVLKLLVHIAIAVWLGRQAAKDGASVSIWVLFGLFFSLLGAILYFVLRSQTDRLSEPKKLYAS